MNNVNSQIKYFLYGTILFACSMIMLVPVADARGFGMGGPMMGSSPKMGEANQNKPDTVERRDSNIRATGMTPVFPAGYLCQPIASPYASPTRYDGSLRRDDRNGGLHGGMDLSLKEGTPLLAVARGTIIAKGKGGMLEGNYLWLKLDPADTGFPFYVFAKYQHLSQVPILNEGDVVEVGQVVALSGNTGTAGGHFGSEGYYHLHLSISAGPSGAYEKIGMFGSMVKAAGANLADPLLLYAQGVEDPEEAYSLPEDRKQVHVPVVDTKGVIHPAGSKTVWPVKCEYLG